MDKKAAVITGDLIDSSSLAPLERKKLQQTLDNFFNKAKVKWPDLISQQYRGDSLQIILTDNRKYSLRLTLLLQSLLMSKQYKIRLALGIGDITYSSKNVVTSDGSAFRASGPYLDELKKRSEFISIAGSTPDITEEWQVHSMSLNFLIQRWSPHQAEAINLMLQEHTQEEIAAKVKIAQPSVHQRLQLAGWPVVQKILNRFETATAL
jgi:hypothetical protein